MDANAELEITLDLERRLAALSVSAPVLCELPIAPLRGVNDLVRLELALRRFAEIHRSTKHKLLLGTVRIMLGGHALGYGTRPRQPALRCARTKSPSATLRRSCKCRGWASGARRADSRGAPTLTSHHRLALHDDNPTHVLLRAVVSLYAITGRCEGTCYPPVDSLPPAGPAK